jgi:hypothetical protein
MVPLPSKSKGLRTHNHVHNHVSNTYVGALHTAGVWRWWATQLFKIIREGQGGIHHGWQDALRNMRSASRGVVGGTALLSILG